MKRQDYISWDEYFMGIALLSAMRSKDNNSQVGACIVSPENKILSLGYNGMPIGCNDDDMPWEREGSDLDTKYMYVCHSELNAILNSPNHDLRGSRMYVTLSIGQIPRHPCQHRQPPHVQHDRRQIPRVSADGARDQIGCIRSYEHENHHYRHCGRHRQRQDHPDRKAAGPFWCERGQRSQPRQLLQAPRRAAL